jgi:Glu-tRNA(Gln) amidotransferase subunit E-like FAD-binding protein
VVVSTSCVYIDLSIRLEFACTNNQVEYESLLHGCHTQFLRPKPDAHRMYAQDQVVIHTVRM